MSIPTTTSLTLLGQLKDGDPTAWERVVDIYGPFLFGRLRSRGLTEEDAADVLQEVFASLSQSIGRFRRDRPGDSFLKWLQTVTTNKLRDFWKKQQRQPDAAVGGSTVEHRLSETPDPIPEEDWSTDSIAKQSILKRALKLIQTEFEESTWKAFWLYVVDEKAADEIAVELNMTPRTQRNARYKVRKRLLEEFGDLMDLPSEEESPPSD